MPPARPPLDSVAVSPNSTAYNRTAQHIARMNFRADRGWFFEPALSLTCDGKFCCQVKSICSRISNVPSVGQRKRTHKSGERMYARIIRARSSKARKSHEPGRALILAGNPLALVCLVIGAAFAIFVSGSLEQRIGNLLVFGLMPAVGLYAACHILGRLLIFGVALSDMLIASCSRKVLRLAQDLLSRAGTRYRELLTELNKRALEPSTRFHTSRSNIQDVCFSRLDRHWMRQWDLGNSSRKLGST